MARWGALSGQASVTHLLFAGNLFKGAPRYNFFDKLPTHRQPLPLT